LYVHIFTVPGQHVIVTDWRFSGTRCRAFAGRWTGAAQPVFPGKRKKLVDRTFSEWDKARMSTHTQQGKAPSLQAAARAEMPLIDAASIAVSALLLGLILIIPETTG